jgi:hypothetical protein
MSRPDKPSCLSCRATCRDRAVADRSAAAVTVSMPILALAAGTDARSIRDRLQRPDSEWERGFAQLSAERRRAGGKHRRTRRPARLPAPRPAESGGGPSLGQESQPTLQVHAKFCSVG